MESNLNHETYLISPEMITHEIEPSAELAKHWRLEYFSDRYEGPLIGVDHYLAIKAARRGADIELEACCKWIETNCPSYENVVEKLRSCRRPKPLTQAEKALLVVDKISKCGYPGNMQDDADYDILRAALKRLQELETNSPK